MKETSTSRPRATAHVSSSETATKPSSPAALGVPFIADWDRYEMLSFIGRGGMGSVYKARDPRLDRVVAIKFVLGSDPNRALRFVQEARAQARIDHPNICRVFEVGEIKGHAYIALQFVDGEPLSQAVTRMTLDEKVAVMRDVAAAMHEAHRIGVVHRDLKPGNVLVERGRDGTWVPVVVDFGLAREVASVDPGLTESGLLLGTPAYMSPEQARGESRSIDQRSDVYSLGATLYEVLTGHVPFSDASDVPTLARVLNEELPSPRSLAPGLPLELEAVARKCLAKDPAQRYASARELADDLTRYLAGQSVLGQRPPLWRRAWGAARRHRVLAVATSAAVVLLVVLAGFMVAARLADRRALELSLARARLAEKLGHDATEIESTLREAYLRPLHDVRPERRRVLERVRVFEEMQRSVDTAHDPYVLFILGRGYSVLERWPEAVEKFQAALAAGFDTAPLHLAFGQALGEMYRASIDEIGYSAGQDAAAERTAQRAEFAHRYLTPALQELREAQSLQGQGSDLLRARIALYTRDFSAAERQARDLTDQESSTSAEAYALVGASTYLAAVEAVDHDDYAQASQLLERARDAYNRAIKIERSNVSLYRSAARTWILIAWVAQRLQRPTIEATRRATELLIYGAHVADPDDSSSYLTEADLLLCEYRLNSSDVPKDDTLLLDRAVSAATRAVSSDQASTHAIFVLAVAELYRGSHEFFYGGRGYYWWNKAAEDLGKVLTEKAGDLRALNALGLVHRWMGEELDRSGSDPSDEYRRARQNYESAVAIDKKYFRARANEQELMALIAEHEENVGRDPRPAAGEARRFGQACLADHPDAYTVLIALTRTELAVARWQMTNKEDPSTVLESARGFLDRAVQVSPRATEPDLWKSEATRIETAAAIQHGTATQPLFTRGRLEAKRLLASMPTSALAHVEIAQLALLEAEVSEVTDRAKAAIVEARDHADKALTINTRLPEAWTTHSRVWQATARLTASLSAVEHGVEDVDEALLLNPTSIDAQKLREELNNLRLKLSR